MMHQELLLSTTALSTLGRRLAMAAGVRQSSETEDAQSTTTPAHSRAAMSPAVPSSLGKARTPARQSAAPAKQSAASAKQSVCPVKQAGAMHSAKRKQPSPMRVLVQTAVDNSPVEAAETCDSGLDMGEPPGKRGFIDPSDDSEEELAAGF